MGRAIGDGDNIVERTIIDPVTNKKTTKLYIRLRFTDHTGKRKSVWKTVRNRTEAREEKKKLLRRVDTEGTEVLEHVRKTFKELADYYSENYLKEAVYVDHRKTAGRRNPERSAVYHLAPLVSHLSRRKLQHITYEDIKNFKNARLAEEVVTSRKIKKDDETVEVIETRRPRTIASVNRELQMLRHMLNVAVRHRWLIRNPFKDGEPLISKADEKRRNRLLTFEEEKRLLAECVDTNPEYRGGPFKRRAHLRPILICLLDTAMRAGECFSLKLKDVEFDTREFTLEAFNTKTMTERSGPISRRLAVELEKLFVEKEHDPEAYVFAYNPPYTSPLTHVKRSFASACKDAGIDDLRIKDLRRTAATRLVRAGMPIAEVSRILGHTNVTTTYIYVGIDTDTVSRAREIMDEIAEKYLQSPATNEASEQIQ